MDLTKLLKYMKGYTASAVSAPFFKVLEAIFELMIPLVMKNIIDIGIAAGDKPYIFRMCGLLVLLGLVGFTCTMFAQYFAAKAAVGFSKISARRSLLTRRSSPSPTSTGWAPRP